MLITCMHVNSEVLFLRSRFNSKQNEIFFFPFPALTSFKTKCCLSIVEMVKQNCSITYCRTLEYSFIRWRIEFQSVLSLISHFALVFDSE